MKQVSQSVFGKTGTSMVIGGITDFGDGTPPFSIKRYHADGTLAQEGSGLLGGTNHWRGTFRWIKSENPTPELFPAVAKDIDAIWSAEYDYTEIEAVA
jgi:hypothetical protein